MEEKERRRERQAIFGISGDIFLKLVCDLSRKKKLH